MNLRREYIRGGHRLRVQLHMYDQLGRGHCELGLMLHCSIRGCLYDSEANPLTLVLDCVTSVEVPNFQDPPAKLCGRGWLEIPGIWRWTRYMSTLIDGGLVEPITEGGRSVKRTESTLLPGI